MDIDIDHIARLTKLKLTSEERAKMAEQLPKILEYVSKLSEVDTSGIDPKAYLTDATNVFRSDEPRLVDEATHRALIDAFPVKAGEALQVPGVFE